MTVKHPKLLTNGEAMVEKRLDFLFSLGLSDEAVRKIVRSHPQVRDFSSHFSAGPGSTCWNWTVACSRVLLLPPSEDGWASVRIFLDGCVGAKGEHERRLKGSSSFLC